MVWVVRRQADRAITVAKADLGIAPPEEAEAPEAPEESVLTITAPAAQVVPV